MKIGLISDIHSNFEALKVVKSTGEMLGVTAWWCAGDVIGYGPRPVETLMLFREMMALPGSQWVIGNNDAIWLRLLSPETARRESVIAQNLNGDELKKNEELCEWFTQEGTLPERSSGVVCRVGEVDCLIRHTYDNALSRYIKPAGHEYRVREDVLPQLEQHLPGAAHRAYIFGHSHYPTLYWVDGDAIQPVYVEYGVRYLLVEHEAAVINPGGLGQPRDGDPRTAFAVLDDHDHSLVFHRLKYAVDAVVRDLFRKRYPSTLIEQVREAPMAWTNLPPDYIEFLERRNAA